MGNSSSVPEVRAKDLKRVAEGKYGWLNKAGLTNTKMKRRWCAVHDLRLYYYETPRDVVPKGVVNLRGAIVTLSKRVKMAIEIETGSLITEKNVDKRTYVFTPVMTEAVNLPEEMKKEQRRKDKENLDNWYHWLQEESAKTFTPM